MHVCTAVEGANVDASQPVERMESRKKRREVGEEAGIRREGDGGDWPEVQRGGAAGVSPPLQAGSSGDPDFAARVLVHIDHKHQ